jgi:hypothetical protein
MKGSTRQTGQASGCLCTPGEMDQDGMPYPEQVGSRMQFEETQT